ncbi:tetratricopeptide repeat protein [Telmatobacter sp. DSM 110680]|uniref:Tetratricopeptide repeat protein n=1 Tax=Telmatobacter sp. DSM 110680 TaxID=3036704 RepID=A0AAU7DGK1_9BACT
MKAFGTIAILSALGACIGSLSRLPDASPHAAVQQPREQIAASTSRSGNDDDSDTASAPTWSRDIAPVLYKNCATCHHPGGGGPFSLLTYENARRWGPQILTVTQSRFMPPWLPESGYGDFADVRRLSDEDQALLKRWVADKMPQGNLSTAPAPPHYDATWLIGKPDLVLKLKRPFTLNGGGTDVFRNFILPYPLKQTEYVRAMEIRPGAPEVVHHANVIIDRTGSLRRQHPVNWEDGIAGMELLIDSGNRFDPDSHFLFWKPDSPALIEPEGMPWRLDPGNDLILNMHLKPSGKSETLDAQVGLYFTEDPPAKQPMLLALERDDALDIPAGNSDFVVEDSLTLPIDVDVLGVYPHAHYLGHDMKGWAMLPDGQKKWLIWIRDWDIDRQAVYRYKAPILLPKGTVLHMRYSYDNSSSNVHNPHAPPVRVRAGNRSEDEMAFLWLQVLPVNTSSDAPDPRLLLEAAWMRNRLRKTPTDPISLYNYAAALAGKGKFAEATMVFQRLLKITPADERSRSALGVALDGQGKWKEAIETFRAVVAHDQGACDARFDLANVELRHEQFQDAEADFRSQIGACTQDADVHAGLGTALEGENKLDEAHAEFRRSLEIAPGNLRGLLGSADIESEAGDFESAIQLLKQATSLHPDSAEAHEELARAYAQNGNQNSALAELKKAVELAPNDPQLHAALSQVLSSTGNVAQAIEEQRTALKLFDGDADGWNNLGVLESRTGKTAAARADFEHALRLKPDHPQARANLARLRDPN